MSNIIYEIGGCELSIHDIAGLNLVLQQMSDNKYDLTVESPSWMRHALDMLVLEGILRRIGVPDNWTNSWSLTAGGQEFVEDPEILADINMVTEVADMASGFYN